MVFLIGGTQFPFDRLVLAIDDIFDKSLIEEEIFAQIGESSYRPRNFESVASLGKKAFDEAVIYCSYNKTNICTNPAWGDDICLYRNLFLRFMVGSYATEYLFSGSMLMKNVAFTLFRANTSKVSGVNLLPGPSSKVKMRVLDFTGLSFNLYSSHPAVYERHTGIKKEGRENYQAGPYKQNLLSPPNSTSFVHTSDLQ